ncbi:MAG: hypothetical protein DHS20C05_24620 [Hyphococcus sp.]|nr:MAG: hypothetical protein DHS20C05_24620 [Marinicaulis sp.]
MDQNIFLSSLQEVVDLVRWILSDPKRPPVYRAVRPIASLFFSAFFQGLAFAVVIGYMSLSASDWRFEANVYLDAAPDILANQFSFARGMTADVSPTLPVVFGIVTLFALLYLVNVALSASGSSRLIDLGYEYHSASARRLITRYKESAVTGGEKDFLDPKHLISIANSEARYLGRALTILYTSFNALLILLIGLTFLSRTAPLIVFGGIAFVLLAFAAQTLVMSFAIRASRDLMAGSGPNATALAKVVQAVTTSPGAFSVTADNIDRWFKEEGPIREYDAAYQRRLKVGVLSQLVTNLAFVCALVFILIYLISGVGAGSISSATAFADIVIYRFVFGGAVGLLGGFVSFVSLKPYFDNYLSFVDHVEDEETVAEVGSDTSAAIAIVGSDGAVDEVAPGDIIAVAMNGATFSWAAALSALKACLPEAVMSGLEPRRDIALIANEFPLIDNDIYRSSGLSSDIDWGKAKVALPALAEEIDELQSIFNPGDVNPELPSQSVAERWSLLTPRLFVTMGFVGAWMRDVRIIYASDAALRAFPERERAGLIDSLNTGAAIFVHYSVMPAFSMRPFAKRFLVLSSTGVIAEVDPKQVEHAPKDVIAKFNASSVAMTTMMQEETI